jgi:alpha-L-fucosidase 2
LSCRAILLCIALLALSVPVRAQSCPSLQVRNPAGNYIVPGVNGDIPYSGDLALDAYVQQGPPRRPSIVVIHGGGLTSGSRIAHVGQILEVLTRGGYNWFSLDYRLGGIARFDDSLADVRAALAFIRCHAEDFRIDPDRLVLLGEDSGAQLAARLAADRLPGVIGAVLIGGFYDPMPRGVTPTPLLIVHGGADQESPTEHARRYCGQVAANGGRCQLVEVAGASHRSENWWPNQWSYKPAIVAWLNDLTRTKPLPHRPIAGAMRKDIVYSPSAKLRLDAFLPRASAPTAAVIVVHGGGWEAGDKVTYITPILEPLARAGLAWFSIDYRLTPAVTHEQQLEDLRQAIRFVRTNRTRFNIDPARIVLLGESASGQMVAQVATEDRSLAGVVSFYGVYDFNAMVTDASPRSLLVRLFRRTVLDDESRAVLRRYSPLSQARADMPPLLLVNGTGERLWAQAQAFEKRLTELGVSHDVVALDGAPHGMENWEGHPEWMFYKQRVVEWITGRAAFPDRASIARYLRSTARGGHE